MAPSTYLSASSVFLSLLSAAAAADPSAATSFTDSTSGISFQRFSSPQGATAGVALPETPGSSFIGQLSVPLSQGAGWGALGLSGSIEDGAFVAAYPDGKGGVTASLRKADQSVVQGDFKISTISQSVNDASMLYTFLCQNCLSSSSGVSSLSSTLGFGISNVVVADPTSTSTPLGLAVAGNGTFTVDLAAARSDKFDEIAAKVTPSELKARGLSDFLSALTGGSSGNSTSGAGGLLSKLGSLFGGNSNSKNSTGSASGSGGLSDLLSALQGSKAAGNSSKASNPLAGLFGRDALSEEEAEELVGRAILEARKNKTRSGKKNRTAKASKKNKTAAASAKNSARSIELKLEERDIEEVLPILERELEARKNKTRSGKKNKTAKASKKNKTASTASAASKNEGRSIELDLSERDVEKALPILERELEARKNKTSKAGRNKTSKASKKNKTAKASKKNNTTAAGASNAKSTRSIELDLNERDVEETLPILERTVLEARKNSTKKNRTSKAGRNKTAKSSKNGTRATRKNKTAKAGKNSTAASKSTRSIDLPIEERELPMIERVVLEARKNGTKKNKTSKASKGNKTTKASKNGTRATRKNKTAKAGKKNSTAASKNQERAIFERQNRNPAGGAGRNNAAGTNGANRANNNAANNAAPPPANNNNNNNAPTGPARNNRVQQVKRFVEEFLAKRATQTEEEIFGDDDEDDF